MYKLVLNKKVVDVGIEKQFVKTQRNGVVVSCNSQEADGIVSSDGEVIYSIGIKEIYGPIVELTDISEEEYEVYKEKLSKDSDVVESVYEDLLNQVDVLDFVINLKVAEMSSICNQTIVNGIDVQLSDGETHHFSLNTDDQLNLSTMRGDILTGTEVFGYHSDNGDCEFYSKEDMIKIMTESQNWKTYQVTYFNSLRKYIKSMKTVEEVRAVKYGVEVPVEYQTEVLRKLLEEDNV